MAGYDPGFSAGLIAAGGTLGIMIPPSVPLVIYAILTEQNIAKLFAAAFVPGLIATLGYLIVIGVDYLLFPYVGEPWSYNIAKAFAIGVVLFWNFAVNRLWTYRGL